MTDDEQQPDPRQRLVAVMAAAWWFKHITELTVITKVHTNETGDIDDIQMSGPNVQQLTEIADEFVHSIGGHVGQQLDGALDTICILTQVLVALSAQTRINIGEYFRHQIGHEHAIVAAWVDGQARRN